MQPPSWYKGKLPAISTNVLRKAVTLCTNDGGYPRYYTKESTSRLTIHWEDGSGRGWVSYPKLPRPNDSREGFFVPVVIQYSLDSGQHTIDADSGREHTDADHSYTHDMVAEVWAIAEQIWWDPINEQFARFETNVS